MKYQNIATIVAVGCGLAMTLALLMSIDGDQSPSDRLYPCLYCKLNITILYLLNVTQDMIIQYLYYSFEIEQKLKFHYYIQGREVLLQELLGQGGGSESSQSRTNFAVERKLQDFSEQNREGGRHLAAESFER